MNKEKKLINRILKDHIKKGYDFDIKNTVINIDDINNVIKIRGIYNDLMDTIIGILIALLVATFIVSLIYFIIIQGG